MHNVRSEAQEILDELRAMQRTLQEGQPSGQSQVWYVPNGWLAEFDLTRQFEEEVLLEPYKEALQVASQAIEIASDWHLEDVEVTVPARWGMDTEGLEPGWCCTSLLAQKLREFSK
jgi:hypothetical protein